MVNVLIPSKPDDAHAIYVKLALEKKGHKGTIWYTADFPEHQVHSFEIKNHSIDWRSQGIDFEVGRNQTYDAVWLRRPKKPVLPKTIHPDDKENAQNENSMLFQSFWHVIAPNAFWVNPIHASKAASSKLLQLKIARKIGLKIPDTLISNNPKEIKHFIQQQKQGAIYKTLFPTYWIGETEMRLTYTKEIQLKHLPDDLILQSTPGIFQNKIPKAYELRVMYFGDHAIAIKIHSQGHPKGLLDWRYVPTHELILEECRLPDLIHQRCKEFMKQMNLVFGCFDFIVTHDNDYYFLEVNEQGQFLWIEEINPDIAILDTFTEFLLHQDRRFSGMKRHKSTRLGDFIAEAESMKKETIALHQDPGTYY